MTACCITLIRSLLFLDADHHNPVTHQQLVGKIAPHRHKPLFAEFVYIWSWVIDRNRASDVSRGLHELATWPHASAQLKLYTQPRFGL